jgi:hypothetical protein
MDDCTDAIAKLTLVCEEYASWLDEDREPASKVSSALHKAIEAIDRLWRDVNRRNRDRTIKFQHYELVLFYGQHDLRQPLTEEEGEELKWRLERHGVQSLTDGQLDIFTQPIDDDIREDSEGIEQRAKYRLGRLYGLHWRQVHTIVKEPLDRWYGSAHVDQGNPLAPALGFESDRRTVAKFFIESVLEVDVEGLTRLLNPPSKFVRATRD